MDYHVLKKSINHLLQISGAQYDRSCAMSNKENISYLKPVRTVRETLKQNEWSNVLTETKRSEYLLWRIIMAHFVSAHHHSDVLLLLLLLWAYSWSSPYLGSFVMTNLGCFFTFCLPMFFQFFGVQKKCQCLIFTPGFNLFLVDNILLGINGCCNL